MSVHRIPEITTDFEKTRSASPEFSTSICDEPLLLVDADDPSGTIVASLIVLERIVMAHHRGKSRRVDLDTTSTGEGAERQAQLEQMRLARRLAKRHC